MPQASPLTGGPATERWWENKSRGAQLRDNQFFQS